MIKQAFIYFSLLVTGSVYSQHVDMHIIGLPDSVEVPGARVHMLDNNGEVVYRTSSNFQGIARIQGVSLSSVTRMEISSMGYKTIVQEMKGQSSFPARILLQPEHKVLNQVVVTASHGASNQKESAYSSKIITAEKISAMGAVSLNDVLTNEVNIQLQQDNVLGTGIKLQGTGGQNVKILIDGVPVIGRLDGNIDLSQINLSNVERIEIIEGPLSVNYGSDALAGTINIITKKTVKASWQIEGQTFYESVGQYNADLRIGKRFGHHMVAVRGGRYFFDGWSPDDKFWAYPHKTPADTTRTHLWNPKEQYFGGLDYRYIRNNWSLRINYEGYFEKMTNRGAPQKPYLNRAFDDEYLTNRHTVSGNLSIKPSVNWTGNILLSGAFYERNKNTYLTDLTNLEREWLNNPQMQDTTGYKQVMSRGNFIRKKDSSTVSLEIGYEASLEAMRGKRIEASQQSMFYADLFSTLEWRPIEQILVKPGVRYGYNSAYATIPIPSIHTKFTLQSWTLRASYARGFRAPSIKELYFEFIDINHNIIGNADLKAEQSNNFQLNISKGFQFKKRELDLELKTFYNDIRNQITLQVTEGTMEYSYFNLARSQTTGVNFSVEYGGDNVRASLGGSLLAYKIESPEYVYPEFLMYPEARASIQYNWKLTGLSFGLFYKYNGRQPNYFIDAEGTTSLGQTEDYHMMDISVSRSFIKKQLTVSLGLKNLFDVKQVNRTGGTGTAHASAVSANNIARGRSVFLSLRYNFQINSKKNGTTN